MLLAERAAIPRQRLLLEKCRRSSFPVIVRESVAGLVVAVADEVKFYLWCLAGVRGVRVR